MQLAEMYPQKAAGVTLLTVIPKIEGEAGGGAGMNLPSSTDCQVPAWQ